MCIRSVQNGVAERKNRYILEITQALLIESRILKSFWHEAIATAVYLRNCLSTRTLNFKTPLDIFSNHFEIPSSLSLEPGCLAVQPLFKSQSTSVPNLTCVPLSVSFFAMEKIRKSTYAMTRQLGGCTPP